MELTDIVRYGGTGLYKFLQEKIESIKTLFSWLSIFLPLTKTFSSFFYKNGGSQFKNWETKLLKLSIWPHQIQNNNYYIFDLPSEIPPTSSHNNHITKTKNQSDSYARSERYFMYPWDSPILTKHRSLLLEIISLIRHIYLPSKKIKNILIADSYKFMSLYFRGGAVQI